MLDLLEDIGLWGSLPIDVPIDLNKKLLKDEGELSDDLGRYRRLVGKLNYPTITRPNIFICNSVASQFLEAPQTLYWRQLFI